MPSARGTPASYAHRSHRSLTTTTDLRYPTGVVPEALNIADHFLVDRLAEGAGDRIALRLDDGVRTYAQVNRLADGFGRALLELGVRQEERVLVALPDGEAFVGAFFGALKIGAVVVMVNPDLAADALQHLVGYARPGAVVTDPTAADRIAAAAAAAGRTVPLLVVTTDPQGRVVTGQGSPLDDAAPLPTVPTHRDDPAIWLFSGGTTGRPKAVVQTHRSFVNTTRCYAHGVVGYTPDDVTVAVPRLYFGYATGANLLFPFSVGASAVLFAAHPTPDVLLDRIRRHRPTILVTVPKMVAALVDHPAATAADLSSLRLATSAGEALPAALHERWRSTFGVELLDGLGTAEMWHIHVSNAPGAVRPGTLGRAVPGFEVAVRDADGHDLPDGEVGQLWVRGDSRALGYWQDLPRTAATFRGEWVVSGDLVRRDAEGYVTYVGRDDEAMKVGGKWLLPAEVEGCLLEHPRVAAAAVVGAPDAAGLVKPVAFVVAEGDGTADLPAELDRHVLERLEPYKRPRRIQLLDALPQTHLGKADRGALRRMAADLLLTA